MALRTLDGPLQGRADDRISTITDRLGRMLRADPDLSFQIAAYAKGELVLDAWGGPHLGEQSLIVPYSVSKNTIGFTIALLVQRGLLDLDAPVVQYWPEFGQHGKGVVLVRELLSHQAGIPDANPVLGWDELFTHHVAAERLAATIPLWRPGSAFGYHGITIGNLADELVFRVTGRTIQDVYESEVRAPIGNDLYLGLPEGMESRMVKVLPMVPPMAEIPPIEPHTLRAVVLGPRPGPRIDLANGLDSWRFGHPAVSSTTSAKGLATLFAAMVTGVDGKAPVLSAETVATVGQQQVRGWDEVLAKPGRAHGIVFQKPDAELAFGGHRAFGHDGAAGAIGCVDPDTGIAFGYTIARGPWPGGADPRAIRVAGELGVLLG